jgi:hypothetical protein
MSNKYAGFRKLELHELPEVGDIIIRNLYFGSGGGFGGGPHTLEEADAMPQKTICISKFPYYITITAGSMFVGPNANGYNIGTVVGWYGDAERISVWRRVGKGKPRRLPLNKFHSEPAPLP